MTRKGMADETVRKFLALIGQRGGSSSRRELTRTQAKEMVAIREAKRAAKKAGKPWPPSKGSFKISKPQPKVGRASPQLRRRTIRNIAQP